MRKIAISLDAAFSGDYEAREAERLRQQRPSKSVIGIVGFGNFGQFLAKRFVKHGHAVIATSRNPDYKRVADELGVRYFMDGDDFCEMHPDIVVLCTSILSTEQVIAKLPVQRLKRETLIIDVLSVKEFPKQLLLNKVPAEFDILCTHPMFGPESGKTSWSNLAFVYEKVRIKDFLRCESFLSIFADEGCRMVEMSCEEHDRYAASSQFITHTVGRMLGRLQLESSPINTKGYDSLLDLVNNTCQDSFELYYGLFMYNMNAPDELQRVEQAFHEVKNLLLNQLHHKYRTNLGFAGVNERPLRPSTNRAGTDRDRKATIARLEAELAQLKKEDSRETADPEVKVK